MEFFVILLVVGLTAGILWLLHKPRGFWETLLLGGGGGYACLWLVNLLSCYTGLLIPLNPVTAAVTGFCGLPGLVVLILAQMVL